jgi:hypothetical protein
VIEAGGDGLETGVLVFVGRAPSKSTWVCVANGCSYLSPNNPNATEAAPVAVTRNYLLFQCPRRLTRADARH